MNEFKQQKQTLSTWAQSTLTFGCKVLNGKYLEEICKIRSVLPKVLPDICLKHCS